MLRQIQFGLRLRRATYYHQGGAFGIPHDSAPADSGKESPKAKTELLPMQEDAVSQEV